MNFNDTGSAFYRLINDGQDPTLVAAGEDPRSAIYQFSLEKNYDMSTASLLGSVVIDFAILSISFLNELVL